MLHQVGVSFDLYYDARKHKIKISFPDPFLLHVHSIPIASFQYLQTSILPTSILPYGGDNLPTVARTHLHLNAERVSVCLLKDLTACYKIQI